MRQVGFTLLSWELREKDYSREAKRGCLWASERRRVLGSAVTKTTRVFVKPTNFLIREIVKGSRRYREGSMG